MVIERFQQNLLAWFDLFGRKDLPWQQQKTGYRVWVSEIMLQQTQVTTVIPYYQRFMTELPDLAALAAAEQEQVLHLWTGLGYYARGRNLHKAAQQVQALWQGLLPETLAELQTLPGIGRSTAAAILSLAYGQSQAILDGNVKRILSRFFGVSGWPGDLATARQLWALAEQLTPKKRCADFNQALMDLGASLCSRTKPSCVRCPLQTDCQAFLHNQTTAFPSAKPKKTLPVRHCCLLMIENSQQAVLLEKRPGQGIWGGLWAFPQLDSPDELSRWLTEQHLDTPQTTQAWETFRHTFTHYHLHITPIYLRLAQASTPLDTDRFCWQSLHEPLTIGVPTPVLALLKQLLATKKEG